MKLKFYLIFFLSFGCLGIVSAQSIFTNPITGTNPNTANPYTTGQTIDPNITVSGIGRGSGISGANATGRYNANGWSTGAIDLTDYFEFTLTPAAGFQINFADFVYTGQVSAGTPNFAFRSSVDGYTANIGTPTTGGTTISLAAAAYQNISGPITFRLYGYGMAAATTTYSINDFTFNGAVIAPGAEINVQQSGTTYLNGATYNFGSQFTGSSTPITFTIQNQGNSTLNLAAATFTGNGNYVYTTAYASTVGAVSTTTFVVTFSPTATGVLGGNISIPSNDATGSENPYVINFTGTGVTPLPEINVRGVVGANPTINSGDMSPIGTDNTQFLAQTIGNSQTKTFRIENTGSANLTVPTITLTGANPGDFSITSSAPYTITAGNSIDFTITFAPTAAGLRTATVNIANNDNTGSENPYIFAIEGTGNCAATANIITPTSGPEGTEVTITASSNNLTGATVTFNGIAAVVTQVSATQIKAIVPAGATSGPMVTTNSSGCTASTTFTVINKITSGCEGSGTLPSSLFISQFTDSGAGAMSYIEIYNGTGAAVNLNGWSLRFYNNGNATVTAGGTVNLSNVSLPNGDTYTVAVGIDAVCNGTSGGNGELADQIDPTAGGVNFNTSGNNNTGHDHVRLYNGSTHVDSWGVYMDQTWATSLNLNGKGVNFERKNTVTVPNTTYTNNDWIITDWGDNCSDLDYTGLGFFDFLAGTPPNITVHPAFTPSCKATAFSVTATEGFSGGNALAYQWYAVAPNTAAWTELSNTGVYSGVDSATLLISDISGLTGYQYYCQVRESGATCYTASHAAMITGAQSVTWDGSGWIPVSGPNSGTPVVIDGNYNTSANGSFEACSLTINNTRTLTISPNTYVSVVNDLTVATGGSLQIQDDGSLVMIEDDGVVTNNGSTQVARTTTPFSKYDYSYWTSPVSNTTLGAALTGWRLDYSWTFNTANYTDVTGPNGTGPADGFDDNNDTWTFAGAGAPMVAAKAYAVMGPTTLPSYPTSATVTFSGAVNNGVISIPMALSANAADPLDDYNLVGNPYPSSIFADDFINLNTNMSGTLLFWTHSTPISNTAPGPYQSNFITTDYAMYNLGGGVASSNGGAQPTGYVASGQGFFVEAISGTNLIFNNSMRDKTYNNANFYRNSNMAMEAPPAQKDRVWLNFENALGLFSQQLICYTNAATLDVDRGYDGPVSNAGNSVSFYSFIGNDKYRIQGRPGFSSSDIVPLGLSTQLPGAYKISIEHAEGILNDPATSIYLEDKLLQVIHDLKQGPYSFEVALGTTDSRFQLRYTDGALGNPDNQHPETGVVVLSSGSDIKARSKSGDISKVEVYDLLGRQITSRNGVSGSEISLPVFAQQQVLLVRITLVDGTQINRKIRH